VLAEAATIGGAKLVLTVRLYLGLIAPSRERPSVTEDGVIILLSPPIFIAGGVPRFMMALSIYGAHLTVSIKRSNNERKAFTTWL
jgi:hypothetical protein